MHFDRESLPFKIMTTMNLVFDYKKEPIQNNNNNNNIEVYLPKSSLNDVVKCTSPSGPNRDDSTGATESVVLWHVTMWKPYHCETMKAYHVCIERTWPHDLTYTCSKRHNMCSHNTSGSILQSTSIFPNRALTCSLLLPKFAYQNFTHVHW